MSTAVATATSSTTPSATPPPVLSHTEGRVDALKQRVLDTHEKQANVQHDDDNSEVGDPLPTDLKRILVEVARSGQCQGLSWNNSSQPEVAVEESTNFSNQTNKSASGPLVVARRRNASSSSSSYNPRSSPPLHMVPARKKRRNGMYNMSSRRRRFEGSSATKTSTSATTATTRKRPLLLIRTTSSKVCSTGSVGSSGRTSGSEQEGDSTQYECDSEGTSATTNSEISFERREQHRRNNSRIAIQSSAAATSLHNSNTNTSADKSNAPRYASLREAIRVALTLVLDHAYRYRGGYKLSPAETRRNATEKGQETSELHKEENSQNDKAEHAEETFVAKEPPGPKSACAENAFQRRRKRLLALLGENEDDGSFVSAKQKGSETSDGGGKLGPTHRLAGTVTDGPPFTMQRVAEVLVSPERYYTQTHKLCNGLEKLLLVTSSSNAFGGSTGGDTSQSRQEERELAALANEKGRERRLKRRPSSSSEDIVIDAHDLHGVSSGSHLEANARADAGKGLGSSSPKESKSETDGDSAAEHAHTANHGPLHASREYLEAAARASLRSKFDHVAIDAHAASASVERESGGRPSSPPPPSTHLQAHAPGFVRQHLQEHGESFNDPMAHNHHMIARPPSPILFSPGTDSTSPSSAPTAHNPLSPNSSMQLLQMHHTASLATLNGTPLDLVIDPISSAPSTATANVAALLEADPTGRSSASNSDVDSESDDISLDDSASDRSDGSDSGSGTVHYEPFTAARVMALNRMQQQQQRLQSRVLAALNTGSTGGGSHHSYNQEGFRPPADSEYQSGDSIDSMMAEDSGGSDSSSSDLAD